MTDDVKDTEDKQEGNNPHIRRTYTLKQVCELVNSGCVMFSLQLMGHLGSKTSTSFRFLGYCVRFAELHMACNFNSTTATYVTVVSHPLGSCLSNRRANRQLQTKADLKMANIWLQECSGTHKECGETTEPEMPSRRHQV